MPHIWTVGTFEGFHPRACDFCTEQILAGRIQRHMPSGDGFWTCATCAAYFWPDWNEIWDAAFPPHITHRTTVLH